MDTHPAPDPEQQQLARARAEQLQQLRQRHDHEASAASAFALAKALWQQGGYDEAMRCFVEARDRAPLAPDAHVALVRAAIMLGDRALTAACLDRAEAAYPDLPDLAVHRAQHEFTADPQRARDAVARHRENDLLCRLFHQAIDDQVEDRPSADMAWPDPGAQAMWSGHAWLSDHPGVRIVGTPNETIGLALAAASVDGLVLECGVHHGRSLRLLAGRSGQRCHGFDSFQGLPERWNPREDAGSYSTAGVLPEFDGDVQLHTGWFADTLPAFFRDHADPVRLLHIDCDLYSSTVTVLDNARQHLRPGSILLFDDFIGYAGSEAHEFKAFHEFVEREGIAWSVLGGGLLSREVAVRIDDIAS